MLIPILKSNVAKFLSVVDVAFAFIVVAPLVVTFWSTTWKLYDLFIFPNDPVISGVISWLFGFCGQMVLMFYQDSIKKLFYFEKMNFLSILILKFHALFLGHTFVSFWRGVWSFVDATSSIGLGVVGLNIIQNIIALMILRTFRNTLVPPFIVLTDKQEQYGMRTPLQKSKANGNYAFLADCLMAMFVEMLVAFIWHDFWFIHNLFILPDDLFYSALTSLVFGYSLALICFVTQSSVSVAYEKFEDKRVFIYDVFIVICLLAAINVWRGIWTFVTYFAGDDEDINLLLNTLAWTLLMIVNCTFSLSAKDVLKDAEKSGRCGIQFQINYFSEMLHHKTDKTQNISTQL
ncbi:hypothetical protein Bhyg_09105 [Pseudolycoriella hygida]|uniref:Uncharacterized protein n=1 Tax=Pseudolycoriella hygida TaxID=35572 RepID=A0A9Q0N7P6_9DIPT|nr:hypothetical protein Bhyg_09105 [Pseudolycoriella hygida]